MCFPASISTVVRCAILRACRPLAAVAAVALLSNAPVAQAAEPSPYPSRPITIIVPSAAGNINDTVARLIGQELTKKWGQPIIVDNKPGAGTAIGTRLVARAPKDGYTALLTFTAHVQNPWLMKDLGYDPLKDFEPVSEVALSSVILAVSPTFPVGSLPELVKLVQADPGKYTYGSYGVGTTGHILGELLKREANLQMEHLPYNGGPPLANDLVAGHVKFGMIAVGSAMALLKAGKLIPLAITGTRRSALLPDVPTFGELGYEGFEPDAWMGLLFPAGVPKERAALLSAEVARIVRDPAISERIIALNLVPVGNTPEQFATVLKYDYEKWRDVIQKVGIETK